MSGRLASLAIEISGSWIGRSRGLRKAGCSSLLSPRARRPTKRAAGGVAGSALRSGVSPGALNEESKWSELEENEWSAWEEKKWLAFEEKA